MSTCSFAYGYTYTYMYVHNCDCLEQKPVHTSKFANSVVHNLSGSTYKLKFTELVEQTLRYHC